ncbi:MAG: hypothetical protein WC081_02515 [Candidatus Ratteibacteria bacterium]|jgi:hypothetical protein
MKKNRAIFLSAAADLADGRNILLNALFDFHAFNNYRLGVPGSFEGTQPAGWSTGRAGDISVVRAAHVPANALPEFFVGNGVKVSPTKKFGQFVTLPEAELLAGDTLSLLVYGYQEQPGALKVRLKIMKLDSEDGEWSPGTFGFADTRTFPKQARGELVAAVTREAAVDSVGKIELKIENIVIPGHFTDGDKSRSSDINTVGVEVEFENTGSASPAWIFAPSLTKNSKARRAVGNLRDLPDLYRHIPRTMTKLWKGEALHFLLMGSSIDRGSANPPLYVYDENHQSSSFKHPLADGYDDKFRAVLTGSDLEETMLAEPRHFYSYAGRLKRELMNMFTLSSDKILLNFMACDGSCVGEAHSGLKEYCELMLPPDPNVNGNPRGKTWAELYPELTARREGVCPDLVIFGSGANEKTDTPDEAAVFEGAIRYIQRRYPHTEFLFCMFQDRGAHTPNDGDLQALALRYQIPMVDYGLVGDQLTRNINPLALIPIDGHPQAAVHYIWAKQLERAFYCVDPIKAGQAQLHLPERMRFNSYLWEGDMVTFTAPNPRIFRSNAAVLEDTAFNLWGGFDGKEKDTKEVMVNGKPVGEARVNFEERDLRNSYFRHGNLILGDRHVVEVAGANARITAIDMKVCPGRQFFGANNSQWSRGKVKVEPYSSVTGSPCGEHALVFDDGSTASIELAGSCFSLSWADIPNGGNLTLAIDDRLLWSNAANAPYKFLNGETVFIENRRSSGVLVYGPHKIKISSQGGTVLFLGIFSYDTR